MIFRGKKGHNGTLILTMYMLHDLDFNFPTPDL